MSNFIDKTNLAQVIGTTFDTVTVKPLRPKYVFDLLAQSKVWDLNSNPTKGGSMSFPILAAYSANTGALDPTAATITGSQKTSYTRRTVTLEAYGDHSVLDTFESHNETFVNDVADAAWSLTDQAMNSLNLLARSAMDLNKYGNEVSGTLSQTYHAYGSYGFGAGTAGPLKAADVRNVVSRFRSNNVPPFADGLYRGVIDPIQYTQLRADAATTGSWTNSTQYVDNAPFALGEMGDFEGVRFITSNTNEGNGTNTISAYFIAPEFCGKAIGRDVQVESSSTLHGPQQNLLVMNWNALVGYKIVRREAGIIVQTTNTRS
jgi:N4-gp56 family major capsid protein